jgi:hypothetical protein
MADLNDWMDEARVAASMCWQDDETAHLVEAIELREAIAKRIAGWIGIACQNQQNADYYRGLLERCGKAIGDRAKTAHDGTKLDEVLVARIPEIIEADYINGYRRVITRLTSPKLIIKP